MNRIGGLVALFTVTYAVTRWTQRSNRVRAAITALRGRTVIYRAVINGGMIDLRGRRGGFVAETSLLNSPIAARADLDDAGDG